MKWLLWTSFASVKFGLPGYVLHRFHPNVALVNFWADLNFKALKDRMWRSFLRLTARWEGESSLRRATTTGTSKWGTHRKSQEAKVQFKYSTRSPANTEKQVCASISIKVVLYPKKWISLEKNFAGDFYHHFIGIYALTSNWVFSGHMT